MSAKSNQDLDNFIDCCFRVAVSFGLQPNQICGNFVNAGTTGAAHDDWKSNEISQSMEEHPVA